MPSGAIPADHLIEALVELALTNCTGDERVGYTPGVEVAAAAVVTEADDNQDGMITDHELEEMIRSAEEEVGDAADAVIAALQPDECLVGHILDETSAATTRSGRMLEDSHQRQRRLSGQDLYSNEDYVRAVHRTLSCLHDGWCCCFYLRVTVERLSSYFLSLQQFMCVIACPNSSW